MLSKKEQETGVPDTLVESVFMNVYRHRRDVLSPDKLANSTEQKEVFRNLLGSRYAGAPLQELGNQIVRLRKSGRINMGTGRMGPKKTPRVEDVRRAIMANAFAMRMSEVTAAKFAELVCLDLFGA